MNPFNNLIVRFLLPYIKQFRFLFFGSAGLLIVAAMAEWVASLENSQFFGAGFLPIRRDKAYRWLVDLSQLDFWPAVKNGLISPTTARQIFHFFSKQRKVHGFDESGTMSVP